MRLPWLLLCLLLIEQAQARENFIAPHYDRLLITELMADPSPSVGLPVAEYLELYNYSPEPVSLQGWKLQVGKRLLDLPRLVLQPGAYLLLTEPEALPHYPMATAVAALSPWPGLANEGGELALWDAQGQQHSPLTYDDKHYGAGKKDGGYALEVADIPAYCMGIAVWQASPHPSGGTPGQPNLARLQQDWQKMPLISSLRFADSLSLEAELLIPLRETAGSRWRLSPGLQATLEPFPPTGGRLLRWRLASPAPKGYTYTLLLEGMESCTGMPVPPQQAKVHLPMPVRGELLLLSELMFDPRPPAGDYVELYNASEYPMLLQGWQLRNQEGTTRNIPELLLPARRWALLCEQPERLKEQFPALPDSACWRMDLPSFPQAGGHVELLSPQQQVAEILEYTPNMHHPLLRDTQGISLERASYQRPDGQADNWRSAVGIAVGGTPGAANSQQSEGGTASAKGCFSCSPQALSVDMDGRGDAIELQWRCSGLATALHALVVDPYGQQVFALAQGQPFRGGETLRWQGQDAQGRRVPLGHYALWLRWQDEQGGWHEDLLPVAVVR